MDSEKRFFLAIFLSILILTVYPYYLRKINPPVASSQTQTELPQPLTTTMPKTDSIVDKVAPSELSQPATPIRKENKYNFSHKFLEAEFTDLGGAIIDLKLKNWGKPGSEKIVLIDSQSGNGAAFLTKIPGQGIDFANKIFTLETLNEKQGEVVFSAEEPNQWLLRKKYKFSENKPAFDFQIELQNLSAETKNFALQVTTKISLSGAHNNDLPYAQAYIHTGDKLQSIQAAKIEKTPKILEGRILWQVIAMKYFAIILKPEKIAEFSKVWADGKPVKNMYGMVKTATEKLDPGAIATFNFKVYSGPQYYNALKSYKSGFEEILSLGFFGIFKLWLLLALQWVHKLFGNYGWAIVIVTMAIKLIFTPLTHISFESMKKMQQIQPKMKSIQERYKDDKAKQHKETMELYKKYKVNPMAGCLPMLIQIPIFIAFYQILSQTVELKGAPFIWWIKDLSEPDKLFTLSFTIPFLGNGINILPLLMVGSMVWQQELTPQTAAPEQQQIMRIMPIFMGFIFYNLPSGLVLYWFLNNMLSIFHQLFIKGKALPHHEEEA